MRNPFRSRPNDQIYDENIRPVGSDGRDALPSETWGSKPISIKTNSSTQEDSQPREYKLSGMQSVPASFAWYLRAATDFLLSEIDRSGTYLPVLPSRHIHPIECGGVEEQATDYVYSRHPQKQSPLSGQVDPARRQEPPAIGAF